MVVLGRHIVFERERAEGLAHPGDHVEVFDRDRHTGQRRKRAGIIGLGHRLVRLGGLVPRHVGGDGEERPDAGVERLDAIKVVAGDLHRGQLAAADGGGEFQY